MRERQRLPEHPSLQLICIPFNFSRKDIKTRPCESIYNKYLNYLLLQFLSFLDFISSFRDECTALINFAPSFRTFIS